MTGPLLCSAPGAALGSEAAAAAPAADAPAAAAAVHDDEPGRRQQSPLGAAAVSPEPGEQSSPLCVPHGPVASTLEVMRNWKLPATILKILEASINLAFGVPSG